MIQIPQDFFEVQYSSEKYPGNAEGLESGANCQQFCYEILRHFGFEIGNLRSSDLWEDQVFTKQVETIEIFDLLLFNSNPNSYGAHVGICVGEDQILHLSKKVGKPSIWSLEQFLALPEYQCLVGIKRPIMKVLEALAKTISSLTLDRVQRIAIDGVDGSGKTTFADRLAPFLEDLGRPVIRASVDGFHNPREVRYKLGKTSPQGFYRDSYNYPLLKKVLLDPLSPDGDGKYVSAVFDVKVDRPVSVPEKFAKPGSILVFDGIFLHRPELRNYWDFSIFLDVPFEETFSRMAIRDGCSIDLAAEVNRRYIDGQKLYLSECNPKNLASIVVDNSDFENPRFVLQCSEMKIRPALPDESKILSDLAFRSKSFWPYNPSALESYRESLSVSAEEIQSGTFFVGEIEEKIVGFYGISADKNKQRLYFLFVDPEYIGKGYGFKLWSHAVETAKAMGWSALTFFSDAYAGEKFYLPLGCIRVGERDSELGKLLELRFEF